MPSGSCFCGKVKFKFTGEPLWRALCHCGDCRKLSGSAFSTNFCIPSEGFTFEGSPKGVEKDSDSGNKIVNYFCGDCGSPLWGTSSSGTGLVVRAGCIDGDGLEDAKPELEVYSEKRVSWLKECEGATSVKGMGRETAGKDGK